MWGSEGWGGEGGGEEGRGREVRRGGLCQMVLTELNVVRWLPG